MADVIVSLRVMPEGVDVDLGKVEKKVKEKIDEFGGGVGKVEIEEVAFGLKALKIIFVVGEEKSDLEKLENEIKDVDDVKSCDVVDVRRAVG